jgi:mannose-6-phosphate isomerase
MWDDLLVFQPLYQQRPWGGRRMEHLLGRTLPADGARYGESWEICDRAPEQSLARLPDGAQVSLHELWTQWRQEVFGAGLLRHDAPRFPLLLKILDASEVLSIQVHPPQSVAAELGGEPKTEMWHVAAAEPGARIYAGLRPGVSRADFENAVQTGAVESCVQVLHPRAGDTLFIPSGLVHAIGAGLLIYELQQNSDTTYRVFDWNRLMPDGKKRPLHIAESLRAIDDSLPVPELRPAQEHEPLVACECFVVWQRSEMQGSRLREGLGRNLILVITAGSLEREGKVWPAGTTALVPAAMSAQARARFTCTPGTHWLEMWLPEGAEP